MNSLLATKKGVVLILTFIIMITLTTITVYFLYMTSFQLKGSAFDVRSSQAFWLAEAGIQDVLYQLKNDSDYRDSPTTVTGSLGQGSYSVTVSKNGSTYTLTSTGTVDVINRKITQSVVTSATDFPDAFDYVVFGNTNADTLKIKNEVAISGNVYYDGDVEVEEDASVTNGLVYADSVTGDGTYTAASGPPDPVPTYPTFDTTWYDGEITTAEGQVAGNWKLEGSATYDLDGGTVYYNGKVTIKDNATITGTGTIVATGDVKFEDDANISTNVTIVSKRKIEVKNNAIVQSGAVLYGKNEIKLQDSASVTGSLLVPTSNKKIKMEDNATLTGIAYSDKVEIKGDAVVSGSVVANEYDGDKIEDNASLTFSQASLPSSVPTGLEVGSITVTPQTDWDEIVPAS